MSISQNYATKVSVFREISVRDDVGSEAKVVDASSFLCDSVSFESLKTSSLLSMSTLPFFVAWNGCRNVAISKATRCNDFGDLTLKSSGLSRLSTEPGAW